MYKMWMNGSKSQAFWDPAARGTINTDDRVQCSVSACTNASHDNQIIFQIEILTLKKKNKHFIYC